MKKMTAAARTLAVLVCVVSATGCGSSHRAHAHESVARQWYLALRSQQVIPAYPISSDVAVGDVLLSDPTEQWFRESVAFNLDGFMSISQRVGNIAETTPDGTIDTSEGVAAFPAISFSADRSTSVSAGLPLESVSIGLTHLDSRQATVSVVLTDVQTEGVDLARVPILAFDWWDEKQHQMRGIENRFEITTHPLRIVTRVFKAREVSVSITSESSRSGGLHVEAMDRASGSVEVVAKTANSITMRETFEVPLVIGYHAVDVKFTMKGDFSGVQQAHGLYSEGAQFRWTRARLDAFLFDYGLLLRSIDRVSTLCERTGHSADVAFEDASRNLGNRVHTQYGRLRSAGLSPDHAYLLATHDKRTRNFQSIPNQAIDALNEAWENMPPPPPGFVPLPPPEEPAPDDPAADDESSSDHGLDVGDGLGDAA